MEPGGLQKKVLVVDDDAGLLRLIDKALQREGFATAAAASGDEALRRLSGNRFDLMLLDLKLQDVEAAQLVDRLSDRQLCPPFIIITGQGDERVAVDMMKRGARDYLVKDVNFLQFVPAVVKRALEQLDKERRLAEAEEQVHLIRSVVDQGFSAVLITTGDLPDPRIVYFNPAFARATGYSLNQVVGKPLSTLSNLTNLQLRLRAGLPGGARFIEEISTYQTAEGERWGEWRVGPVRDRAGKETHWLIIFLDITERKRLEREILEISDRERRRLGQDLHDGLCQQLAGIELMSQVLEQKLVAKFKSSAERAGDIARHVRGAISQTRALARGLAPVTLESEGLASALQELATNAEKMFNVACTVECGDSVQAQPTSVATHLYRIAQEAVSNAIKHGKATDLTIQLDSSAEIMRLTITDNGSGFRKNAPSQKGMGLRIMQYRAGLINGTLSVQPGANGGTTVTCSIPLRASAAPGPG